MYAKIYWLKSVIPWKTSESYQGNNGKYNEDAYSRMFKMINGILCNVNSTTIYLYQHEICPFAYLHTLLPVRI